MTTRNFVVNDDDSTRETKVNFKKLFLILIESKEFLTLKFDLVLMILLYLE